MHVGHRVGLWPEALELSDGVVITPSNAQLQLLEYWKDFWAGDAAEADTVALLGDLTEGKNRLEGGAGLMVSEMDPQKDAAVKLLKPYTKGKRVISVIGSKYHSSSDSETDTAVVNDLNGTDYGVIKNLRVKGPDRIVNISHVAGDALIYKSTQIDRDSLFFDAIEGSFDYSKLNFHVDLYIRGHWHWYLHMENESRHLVLVPCWKFWHPFRRKGGKNYAKTQPTIGAVVVDIGRDHILVKKHTYPLINVYDALEEV
jgi:hypothetical protein